MRSPHTGTVTVEAGGETVALRFSWASMAALHGRFGKGWEGKVESVFADLDVDGIAAVLEAASDRPAAWWRQASPPVVPTARAASEALLLAFYGPGGEREANPLGPLPMLATAWRRLFVRGARSEATQKPSGA